MSLQLHENQEFFQKLTKIINLVNLCNLMHLSLVCPRMWGVGQPREIRLCKAHMGWDFDIHNNPRGGTFDLTAILKSREDLGMSDEWCTILNIPKIHVSEFSVSKNTILCREYCIAFFKAKK